MDQALLLEQGHVVAHGGRADAEVMSLDQRLAPDGLGGLDVVLDDGAQHHQPALLAHPSSFAARELVWHSRLSSAKSTPSPRRRRTLVRARTCRYAAEFAAERVVRGGSGVAGPSDRASGIPSLTVPPMPPPPIDRYGSDVLSGDWQAPPRGRSSTSRPSPTSSSRRSRPAGSARWCGSRRRAACTSCTSRTVVAAPRPSRWDPVSSSRAGRSS